MASPTQPTDRPTPPTGPDAVAELVRSFLDLRTWQAFDVDEHGRVLAGHDELGSVQLVEIEPDGTRTALTDLPSRCSGRYVPGARQLVVQHDAGGDENMQLSLLDLTAGLSEPATLDQLTPLVHDPAYMHVLRDVTSTDLIYSTNRRNGVDMDVVVRSWRTGEEQVVYDGGGYVASTVVSHDGTSVAVTALSLQPASTYVFLAGPRAVGDGRVTDPAEHAMHGSVHWAQRSAMEQGDTARSATEQTATARSATEQGVTEPDAALVLSSNHEREFTAVWQVSLDGSSWTPLVSDDAHDLDVWSAPDGSALVVGTHVDGAVELAVHEPDGSLRCPVGLGDQGVVEVVWAADSSRFAVTISRSRVPSSIELVDASTGTTTLVADGREGLGDELAARLVEPSVHRVPAPDGEQVPCFVYVPATAVPGLAGASVVLVHGGPEGASTRLFNPVIQSLAACGFTVLVPNVRGSVGYGKRWYSLDDVDLRLDSVADLAALHDWLPSHGLDPRRSALWGGSYGGYMVLAGTAMQPERWAAGVDIVGISSLVTFLENTSGYRRAYREREYGSLEHDRELLVRASPITYLHQLRAPLFVIHGANDPRVPLSEAEQIVAALAERGVPHELKVYADEGHGLAKRANRQDAYPAAIGFLIDHLSQDRG